LGIRPGETRPDGIRGSMVPREAVSLMAAFRPEICSALLGSRDEVIVSTIWTPVAQIEIVDTRFPPRPERRGIQRIFGEVHRHLLWDFKLWQSLIRSRAVIGTS